MAVEVGLGQPLGAEHALEGAQSKRASDTSEEKLILWPDRLFLPVHGIVLYYLLLLLGVFWALLDIWSGSFRLLRALGLDEFAVQQPMLRSVGYTLVGGMLGNILYQIRTLFRYYIKSSQTGRPFDPRWLGKYLSAPWESAAMALVVLSIIRGGLAAFGSSPSGGATGTNNFAALGTGALIGFGMRDVVGWVGRIVRTVFVAEENGAADKPTEGEDAQDG